MKPTPKGAKRRPRTSTRDRELHVRCTRETLDRWRRAAASRGLSLSYWASYELNAAASEDEERMWHRMRPTAMRVVVGDRSAARPTANPAAAAVLVDADADDDEPA